MARNTRSKDWGFPRWRGYGSSFDAAPVRLCDRAGCEQKGDPDADFDAVKKAWRNKAKEVHPDVRPGDKAAAEQFQKLQVSYEVLRAAEDRREWKG